MGKTYKDQRKWELKRTQKEMKGTFEKSVRQNAFDKFKETGYTGNHNGRCKCKSGHRCEYCLEGRRNKLNKKEFRSRNKRLETE